MIDLLWNACSASTGDLVRGLSGRSSGVGFFNTPTVTDLRGAAVVRGDRAAARSAGPILPAGDSRAGSIHSATGGEDV